MWECGMFYARTPEKNRSLTIMLLVTCKALVTHRSTSGAVGPTQVDAATCVPNTSVPAPDPRHGAPLTRPRLPFLCLFPIQFHSRPMSSLFLSPSRPPPIL